MANEKKKRKSAAYAKMLWEKAQLRAATATGQLDKSVAVILQYKDELAPAALTDALTQVEKQRGEVKDYLLKERDKFGQRIDEIGEKYFRELLLDDALFQKLKTDLIENPEED
jgi:hypothetical protein